MEDSAPVIMGSSTDNTLTINAEKDQTASVTLSGVNIDVSGKDKAAVSTTGEGNVGIELNGDSTLKSDEMHAGLEKNNGGSLTIADEDKNGKLTAEGGDWGAGIGGGDKGAGSNIIISGGDVKATGGAGSAGIGGGESREIYNGNGSDITISGGNGSDITISGGEITAIGGENSAGIGAGHRGNGNNITISGGEVKAIGDLGGAGIGGGPWGKGKDITVSGAAKLKVQGGVEDDVDGAGAGIGDGGSNAEDGSYLGGSPVPGAEVEPDTSGLLTTGWIEYYAPGADMETDDPIRITRGTSSQPEKPIERGADAPLYRMTDRDGRDMAYMAEQTGGMLTVTVDEDFAVLTGSLSDMTALRTQGVEKLVFVTRGATSAFLLSDLLGKGESGESYWLTHDGKAVTFTLGENMASILTNP